MATMTENWFLLMDPAWRAGNENEAPPVDAVVGLWPVEESGELGKFRSNPGYRPADASSPTDPLDAVLRLAMLGRAEPAHIQLMLRDTLFDLAVGIDGRPLVTKSPDDVACVVVATGEPHRARVVSPGWWRVGIADLVKRLGGDVDVLFNPGGPSSIRLTGDFMRETASMDDADVSRIYAEHHVAKDLQVIPWDIRTT
jgi:hypothetical protein